MKVLLLLVTLPIVISIGCTSLRPASSQSTLNNNSATVSLASSTASPAQEQKPCMLTLAGLSAIEGLRLGMTTDEVLALFPGSKDDAEVRSALARPPSQYGSASLVIRPDQFQSKEQYKGIRQITFSLLDGRVANFTIGYNGPEYPHVDQFVESVAKQSGLPSADNWEAFLGQEHQLKKLRCKEVEISVYAGGPGGSLNYVLVRDLLADKELKERRDKAKAKATPTP